MKNISRKDALNGLIVLPALAGAVLADAAPALAKGSKAQFKYQDAPNGTQKCSGCSLFVAGKTASASGTCKIIDGTISPSGWCTAFAAKA